LDIAEATSKPRCEIVSKALEQLFSILRAGFAALFELDDVAPNLPVGGSHHRIDGTNRLSAGFDQ